MNTLLQLFTQQSLRWSQRLLGWGLALVMVIGVAGLFHQTTIIADHGHQGAVIQQVLAQGAGGTAAPNPAGTPPVNPPVTPQAGGGIIGGINQSVGNVVGGVATLFIKLLAGILWFVLYWMGDLMDNTFILQGDIGEKLHSVWVIIRNYVNIFFALSLVVVAFMSVIGVGDESGNYGLKKFIPKVALALIAVNFTFFACTIVLDINNVLTTAIFDIPRSVTTLSDIGPTGTSGVKTFKKFKCLSNDENFDQATQRVAKLEENYKGVINQLGGICFATPYTGADALNQPDSTGQMIIPMGTAQYNQRNFVWTMATQFQGLQNLNKVSQLVDPTFTGLTVNALFSIIFAVIYGTAYIAMFIILVGRMCVLWITIMLSPLVAVSIVFPDLLTDKMDIQKQFLDHAFVPVKMAIPLALGYILISQMSISIDTSSGIAQANKIIDLSQGGEFARGVSITTLMYGISSIAVIWFAVFTAKGDVVGSGMVDTLKGYVEGAGSTVAKWPTYLPIFPVAGQMASVSSLQSAMGELQNQMRESGMRKDRAFYDKTLGKIFPRQEVATAVADIQQMVRDKTFNAEKARTALSRLAQDDQDPVRFRELTKQLTTAFAPGAAGSADLARVLGVSSGNVADLNSDAKIEEARKKLAAPGGAPVPSTARPDYSSAQTALRANSAIKFTADASQLSGAGRELFGMDKTKDTGKKENMSFNDLDPVTFMEKFSARDLSTADRRTILDTNMGAFTAMSNESKFQELATGDETFRRALKDSFNADPAASAFNSSLFGIHKNIYNKGRSDDGKIKQEDGLDAYKFS